MASNEQDQTVGTSAIALQAGRDVIVHAGMSYSDVKQAALEVFEANFFRLAGQAAETATARAEAITERYLDRLRNENPSALKQANDPAFQHALFTVQREHARTGDKDLGELLVDLLVDRSKQEQRNILQIVLDESLNTAPKLTEQQLANLAMVFLFRYSKNEGVLSHALLGTYFDTFVQPFAEKLVSTSTSFQHLEFTGCGSIGIAQVQLPAAIGNTYQGLFLKGHDRAQILEQDPSFRIEDIFTPCLNNPDLLQASALNHSQLDSLLERHRVSDGDKALVKRLFDERKQSEEDVRAKCVEIRLYMERVFEAWEGSPMKAFTLTSVGIAIAHANIKRIAGEFADLSIWIN